jgi:Mn2+/Fe2+ NRAMP family transporter
MTSPPAGAGNLTRGPSSALGRRRRVAARTRLDFWFDAALLVGYTLAYAYGFTGIAIHEWLGIALGLALLFHLTLHWDWVIRTTRKLLVPRGRDKLIWAVNLLLMLAMVMCVVSGIVISRVALPSMGINPQIGPSWQRLHVLTAEITLGLVPVHVALRWRWIVRVARRLWTSRSARRAARRAA